MSKRQNDGMPAGYDPKLDTELEPLDELDSQFSAPPDAGGNGGDDIDAQLFGGGGDDYDPTQGPAASGTSIFEAAVSAEREARKQKGPAIPAYARELAKLQEQDEDEDEPEEDEDEDVTPEDPNDDLDLDDADFDFDEDPDVDDEFDLDEDEVEEEEEIDVDVEDQEQADRWRGEDEVDEEMARLLGTDSPYVQGTRRSGSRTHGSTAYDFDTVDSSAYTHAVSSGGYVDEDLLSATKFNSGGFIEYFDDGFVYVSGNGATLAMVHPEDEDDEPGLDDEVDDSLRGLLLFKPTQEVGDEEEIVIELSGEELDELIDAFTTFRTSPGGAQTFMERARQKAKQSRKNKRKRT